MKIFYNEKQNCTEANSYSPSAGKPALFVADTIKNFPEVEVVKSTKVSFIDLYRAHSQSFIEGVLAGKIENGFNNCSLAVAATLPYTSGSLLYAAHHAVYTKEHVCSPTSGFHHAGYGFAGGYCTFNGLMVAAATLYQDGAVKKVGILDLDAHYGNGTADIIKQRKINYVKHHTFGAHFIDKDDCNIEAFESWLTRAIANLQDCDLIIYQAGADPHVRDPLGGFLSTEQMRLRDRQVFQSFKGKPLVWNLAGGYQRDAAGTIEPVLALHRNTVQECIDANAKDKPPQVGLD